jgi:protein-export membrane protein SecD
MKRSLQIKAALIVVLAIWAGINLWPTLQLSRMSAAKEKALASTPEGLTKLDKLHSHAIKRGLDLQGGMYLVLDVDQSSVEKGTSEDAIKRTLEILRNRIDQFGVSEPDVRREGTSRIIVQLPGLQDAERAKRLIGKTARLEFRMVREGADVTSLLARLDRVLAASGTLPDSVEAAVDQESELSASDSTAADSTSTQTAQAAASDSSQGDLLSDLGGKEESSTGEVGDWEKQHPLTALMGPFLKNRGALPVSEANKPRVEALLKTPAAQRVMPRDVEWLWGSEQLTGNDGRPAYLLYLVDKKIELTGGEVRNAGVTPDPDRPPLLMVNLGFSRRGGIKFANVTGANVGRKLGIVLDDVVISAPNIRQRIPNGSAVISGGFESDTEARDLALMLRAGALPADVSIAEERTVGPSLGRDSIKQGVNAAILGFIVVVIFIILYYRLAGVLATFGLFVTLLLLMGLLAQLHLTLTLPGIAGIILTVGMAVDANVLIFERIREELRVGKTVRASIDAGYANATRTIVDANITTFIAAVVLYYFGTGPIKGFAVTLSIGILTSMFSALIFTRTVYDFWLQGRTPRKLSI